MTVYKPQSLDKNAPIVDPETGRITPYFQRFWQNLSFTAASGGAAGADLSGKVDKGVSAGWTAATGTATKTTFSTYTAPTASATYDASQMQALMSALQTNSQHLKAVIDALLASGLITS